MKRKVMALALAMICLSMIFVGCGGQAAPSAATSASSTSAESAPDQAPQSLDVSLKLASATTGGVFFAEGTAFEQLSGQIDGVTIFNQASNGSGENLTLLSSGDVDLALAHNTTALPAYDGYGQYEGKANKDFVAIGFIWYNTLHVITSNDSNISAPSEMAGKRVAVGALGSAVELITSDFLSVYGLDFDAVEAQRLAVADSVEQMKNHQLDAFVHGSILPDSNVTDIMSSNVATLLSMEDDAVERLCSEYSMFAPAVIPANTYPGQTQELTTAASAALLLARPDVDEEAVYRLTKAIYESNDLLMSYHSSFKDTLPENALDGVGDIPLHPGAERYYKEIGIL